MYENRCADPYLASCGIQLTIQQLSFLRNMMKPCANCGPIILHGMLSISSTLIILRVEKRRFIWYLTLLRKLNEKGQKISGIELEHMLLRHLLIWRKRALLLLYIQKCLFLLKSLQDRLLVKSQEILG